MLWGGLIMLPCFFLALLGEYKYASILSRESNVSFISTLDIQHVIVFSTQQQYSSLLLAIIVEKSKKCLDFSVTLFLIHIILCSIYSGFPKTWDWWIIHILGMIVMVILGEYFCSKRELSDIPLLVL